MTEEIGNEKEKPVDSLCKRIDYDLRSDEELEDDYEDITEP